MPENLFFFKHFYNNLFYFQSSADILDSDNFYDVQVLQINKLFKIMNKS